MSSSYPAAIDSLPNPTPGDTQAASTPVHSSQHANANNAIVAVQQTLGTNPQGAFADVAARLASLAAGGTATLASLGAAPTGLPGVARTAALTLSGNHADQRQTFTGAAALTLTVPLDSAASPAFTTNQVTSILQTGTGAVTIAGAAPGGVAPLTRLSLESLTAGTALTASNAGVNAVVPSSTGTLVAQDVGTRRTAQIASGGTASIPHLEKSLPSTITETWASIYVFLASAPSITTPLFRLRQAGSTVAQLRYNVSGKLDLIDSANSVGVTSTLTFPTGRWVRVEVHVLHSATVGVLGMRTYNSGTTADAGGWQTTTLSETELATTASKNTGTGADEHWMGILGSQAGLTLNIDGRVGNTTWLGPDPGSQLVDIRGTTLSTNGAGTALTLCKLPEIGPNVWVVL